MIISRAAVVLGVLALLVASTGVGIEAQTRRLPPGAAILGQVVEAGSGRGVDRAVVTVVGGPSPRRILTDRRGRFLVTGLPAGVYAISAQRTGFLNGTLGQRRPDGEGHTLTLAFGQWLANVEVPISRPAVITGLVLDDRGEPLVDVAVSAFRRTWDSAGVGLELVTEARTDDTGTYRFTSLTPGDHLIAATAPRSLPEYYPGSQSVAGASIVTAQAGREITGINFLLAARPAVTLTGRLDLSSIPEGTADRVRLRLMRPGDAYAAEAAAHRVTAAASPAPDGTFQFDDVPVGEYELEAFLSDLDPPQVFWARQTVTVDDKSVEKIEVGLQPGLEVAGRVRVQAQSRFMVALPDTVRVTFDPIARSPVALAARSGIDASGAFATGTTLRPERYRVRVVGLPDGLRVDAMSADGRDVIDDGLDLSLGVPSEFVITVTDRRTLITGMVRGAGALGDPTAAVLVYPTEGPRTADRYFRQMRVTPEGSFTVADLPPGTYALVAVDDAESDGWRNPERRQQWRAKASNVTIRTGEAALVELRRQPLTGSRTR